jgi:hypothetical protein
MVLDEMQYSATLDHRDSYTEPFCWCIQNIGIANHDWENLGHYHGENWKYVHGKFFFSKFEDYFMFLMKWA